MDEDQHREQREVRRVHPNDRDRRHLSEADLLSEIVDELWGLERRTALLEYALAKGFCGLEKAVTDGFASVSQALVVSAQSADKAAVRALVKRLRASRQKLSAAVNANQTDE